MMNSKSLIFIFSLALPGIIQAEACDCTQPTSTKQSKVVKQPKVDSKSTIKKEAPLYLIDQINCVVCGPVENTPICSTLIDWKRNLDGAFVPFKEQVQNVIISQQCKDQNLISDASVVDKYIEGIKKQNNLTETDMEKWAGDVGRTLPEVLELLSDNYNKEMFKHHKFKTQLMPVDDEIKAYYDKNPEFVDGWFDVKVHRFDFEEDNKTQVQKQAEAFAASLKNSDIDTNKDNDRAVELRIMQDELPEEYNFIKTLKDGESYIYQTSDAFEVYQLVAHEKTRIKTLSEQKQDIIDVLNKTKLEKMLLDYNKSIQNYIDIIDLTKDTPSSLSLV